MNLNLVVLVLVEVLLVSLVTSLAASQRRRFRDEDFSAGREYDDLGQQRSTDRPTQTKFDDLGPKLSPDKPKIVVLGASGKIGRLVVKQLLEIGSEDMTILAYVRDYQKALNVLYDDLIPAKNNGPTLQIVNGDLVPKYELPCYGGEEEDLEEEKIWLEKATSAASFYKTNLTTYDNREFLSDANEALEDAIKDCTCVISCVGSVRVTNLWTDLLAVPLFRLLRKDVSRWCKDRNHPYYVHYVSTRKALGYAEREQLRREAAAAVLAEESEEDDDNNNVVPRIRFIRISDLCVGFKPFHFVPLVTNIIQSVVFRYQEMTEQLLDQSTAVETVILRPGDLTDDERDINTTGLQVCNEMVPLPARVSREDVASLAVAAVFEPEIATTLCDNGPSHYTLGVRWVGQELEPFPPQGRKNDGLPDAKLALNRAVKTINKAEKRTKRRNKSLDRKDFQSNILESMANKSNQPKPRPSPHGICVAIPVYFFLTLFLKTFAFPVLQKIPGARQVLPRLNGLMVAVFTPFLRNLMQLLPNFAHKKQYIRF